MNSISPAQLILNLSLQKHPEGGYYKETYRSAGAFPGNRESDFPSGRNYATAIYYLLEQGDFSAFHRIAADECWHFYEGGTLYIHVLGAGGKYDCIHLGRQSGRGEVYQYVVPGGCWFASEPSPESDYVLAGCTVSPGFDFRDFEMGKASRLLKDFPAYSHLIKRLCRS